MPTQESLSPTREMFLNSQSVKEGGNIPNVMKTYSIPRYSESNLQNSSRPASYSSNSNNGLNSQSSGSRTGIQQGDITATPSTETASRVAVTTKATTDALAAVNLQPLTHNKSHTDGPAVVGSHRTSSKPASNNTPTLLPNELVRLRVADGHDVGFGTDRLDITNSKSRQEHSTVDEQGGNSREVHKTSGSFHPSDMGTKNLVKNTHNVGTNRAPIVIFENINTVKPPAVVSGTATQAINLNRESQSSNNITNSSRKNNMSTINGDARSSSSGHPLVRTKSRPKRNPIISPPPTQSISAKKHTGIWQSGRFETRGSPSVAPFTWETYLKLVPAKVAPRAAFRQPEEYPQNLFERQMKLEARDPRNSNNWCIASVVSKEGLHIRLRLEGTDAMNDLYELIDSDNIRPIGSKPNQLLLPPTGYMSDIANYPKFVEKTLREAIIAGPECFPKTPPKPKQNLFEVGMKLEAVDRKYRDFICPATIGEVNGNNVKILFDGWGGSMDYFCEYDSRDLFPINWCRDVGRPIQPPAKWEALLNKEPLQLSPQIPATSLFIDSSSSESKSTSSSPMTDPQDPCIEKSHLPETKRVTALLGEKPKKVRGRPRKHTSADKIEAELSSVEPSPRNNISSTPKKAGQYSHLSDSFDSITVSSLNKSVKMDATLSEQWMEPIEGYQCQRAIPYPDCLRTKQKFQMPRESVIGEEKNSASIDNSSFDLSETIARASPAPEQHNHQVSDPSSEQSSIKQQSKKLKLDTLGKRDESERLSKPIASWTVDDVIDFIQNEDSLIKYSDIFRDHEIDGKAFMLLTTDILVNHMGFKIGPMLKITDLVEQVKRQSDI